ncbi:putative heat shock 70 kDa protein 7 [Spodoptera litura]|uniref:Heat shock 70 kDa protein 7 n=1 Tax=Spodoptera litura TaxID=69820 RepID=A0A9J7EIH5_SPOLT|nr:putative heat shock 70 kDa protein 7 [Spodoptera litura]
MAAIGIDLGTAYTSVAVWRNDDTRIEVIKLENKTDSMPSYVAFTPNGRLFGTEAREYFISDPKNTVFGVYRLIGRSYDLFQLNEDMPLWSFSLTNHNGTPMINVIEQGQSVSYTPQQITTMIIGRVKEAAEKHIGGPVTKAVISVPSFFTGVQKAATRDAAIMAGLEVLRITNDCIAAAVGHRLYHQVSNVIVYDLGGTMSNVSLLSRDGVSVYDMVDTKCYKKSGGIHFDSRIAGYLANDFEIQFGKSIVNDACAMRRLTIAAEEAKWPFKDPTVDDSIVSLQNFYEGHDFVTTLSRAVYDDLCMDLYADTFKDLQAILMENKVEKTAVQSILLVGGGGKIIPVKQMLSDFFDRRILISTSAKPDEVMAIGAAIQATLLNGISHLSIEHKMMPDILPMSLGIEASKGVMVKFLTRHQYIPCGARRLVPICLDMEKDKVIKVYEGERAITEHNHLVMSVPFKTTTEYNSVENVTVILKVDFAGKLHVHVKRKCPLTDKEKVEDTSKIPIKRMTAEQMSAMLAIPQSIHEQDLVEKARLESRYKLERYICDVTCAVDRPGRLNATERQSMAEELERAMQWFVICKDCTKEELERRFLELSYRWVEITHKIFDQFWSYKPFQ